MTMPNPEALKPAMAIAEAAVMQSAVPPTSPYLPQLLSHADVVVIMLGLAASALGLEAVASTNVTGLSTFTRTTPPRKVPPQRRRGSTRFAPR